MSNEKVILLIISTYFCLVQCHPHGPKCPHSEIFVNCAPETQATCRTFATSGKLICGGHCICKTNWQVRDDDGFCIPAWKCPNLCPKNSEMSFNVNQYRQLCFVNMSMMKELKKPPGIGCSCIKNHCWLPNFTECVPKDTCEDYLHHSFLRIG